MKNRVNRRKFISSIMAGTSVAIAGCTNDSGPSEQNKNTTASQNQNSDNNQEELNTPENEDVVHQGEEQLEEYLSSNRDTTIDLGEREYSWVELENPQEQVEYPISTFIEDSAFDAVAQGAPISFADVDTVYVAIGPEESTVDVDLEFVYLDEDQWDEDAETPEENFRQGFYNQPTSSTTEDDVLNLFTDDISNYSDVSDDFPDEYLEAIEK